MNWYSSLIVVLKLSRLLVVWFLMVCCDVCVVFGNVLWKWCSLSSVLVVGVMLCWCLLCNVVKCCVSVLMCGVSVLSIVFE